jgi:class 3 adenylate cyclase
MALLYAAGRYYDPIVTCFPTIVWTNMLMLYSALPAITERPTMDCSACRTANPAQARFCLGCGRRLVAATVCATCHTLLPGHAHFCFHCGAMVLAGEAATEAATPLPTPADPVTSTEPSPRAVAAAVHRPSSIVRRPPSADFLPSLQRFLPQPLYEPLERRPLERDLLAARDHLAALLHTAKTYLPWPVVSAPQPAGQPAGSMVQGTFLFVDVSGFTPLSERLSRYGRAGAEQVTAIINDLFSDLVSILFRHGGSLLKFGGDALLGLFPADSEAGLADGAVAAAQAALAMQQAMARFDAIEAAGETSALRIKCGISSGPYFAAHIGAGATMAFVTTGHTVNRAEQAEGLATPGEVIMAHSSLDLVNQYRPDAALAAEVRAEAFYLVRAVNPAGEVGSLPTLPEPPEAELSQQLDYLVERLDRLAPYLPAELLARMVTHPGDVQMAPDHRPVTAMFANYVGIGDLIEAMGHSRPELITRQLNNYFVHMAQIVEQYEGTLARMDHYAVGDRLVIFFGAPRAHEDDPLRAVYTALAMQEATRNHFAALQTPDGIYRFRQRIGINTGYLFAGNVGAADLRQEYTLMGDDINMAARLMSQAGWGDIFISDKTKNRVAAFIDLKDEGALKVKGKEILIPTYRVLGRRQEVGRTRGLDRGDVRLVDRLTEMQKLRSCGQAFLNGRGQIVSVTGNSGLGKSRLSREFKQWLLQQEQAAGVQWLEGHCLSFSEQVGYWLAAQLLYSALELKRDSNPDDVLYLLWQKGDELLGRDVAREAIPFLAHLLDLPLEGDWAAWVHDLDPKVRQKQTFWAAREFFMGLARQRPLLIALDDMHWADEASLALVEDLFTISDHVPVCLYLIFRERRDKGCWRLHNKAGRRWPKQLLEWVQSCRLDPLIIYSCFGQFNNSRTSWTFFSLPGPRRAWAVAEK